MFLFFGTTTTTTMFWSPVSEGHVSRTWEWPFRAKSGSWLIASKEIRTLVIRPNGGKWTLPTASWPLEKASLAPPRTTMQLQLDFSLWDQGRYPAQLLVNRHWKWKASADLSHHICINLVCGNREWMCPEQSPLGFWLQDSPPHPRGHLNITKSWNLRVKWGPSSGCMQPFLCGRSSLWGQIGDALYLQSEAERCKWVSPSLHLLARKHTISPLHNCSVAFSPGWAPRVLYGVLLRVDQHLFPFSTGSNSLTLLLKAPQRNTAFRLLIRPNSWSPLVSLQHAGPCLNNFLHSFLPSTGHFSRCPFLSLKSAHL